MRRSLTGEPLATHVESVRVPPRSVHLVTVPERLAAAGDPARELLVASCGQWRRALWFFAEDRDIDYPAPDFAAEVTPAEGGVTVTVTARTLLRDLVLQPDRVDPAATVDEALVTLLPGRPFGSRSRG
ncbi:hypothetical protein ACFQX7_37290 [Luedemannella flava]